jgi:CheY-like chemotaxis protein
MATARKKILCIEDDRETAALIAEELVDRGFEVSIARNGQEGFVAILRDKPDLVLCDIGVPIMSGFEILERLTELAPRFGHTPFVFLTALADRNNELKGRRLGADDYVTKPIDFDVLATKVGVLLAIFVFEVFLNGFFLSKGSELGYLGGAAEAFTFALLNVGVSFLIAAAGVRELNHRNLLRKLFGLFSLLCYLALAAGLNLALAHYREVSGSLISDAGREVLVRLQSTPLGIADVKSWLFFALGILCSLIAFADAFLIFDPYPGYGALEKRRADAHDAYIRRKNDLIAKLLEIRDDAIEILEEANRDLSIRRGEHDAILESRARLVRLFAAHQSQLDRAANALLAVYREANKRGRKTPPPPRFSATFTLDKFPIEQGLLEMSARDDLRHSIAESQAMLVGQVQAIHAEFEKAFASYREIDELVEEKTVVKSDAKAA